jgi:hypothetical protein
MKGRKIGIAYGQHEFTYTRRSSPSPGTLAICQILQALNFIKC